MDVDVVPTIERPDDFGCGCGIGRLEIAERLVRKHDAPPEGIGYAIAFDDPHDSSGIRAL
jgi:hypothetical protein